MAQILSFFPRQAVVGGSATLYSEVYDISDVNQIVAEFRIHSISTGAALSAYLEDTPGPDLPDASWRTLFSGSFNAVTSSAIAFNQVHRFVRAKIWMPSQLSGAIVSFLGIGRVTT